MIAKKHSRVSYILMSTLVLPGLGQCALKKWIPGVCYALGFLLSALIFLLTLLGPLVKNLRILTDMSNSNEVSEVAWPHALFGLGAAVLIYIINFADIIIRTKKRAS